MDKRGIVKMRKTKLEIVKVICKLNNVSLSQLEKELKFSKGQIGKWKNSAPSVDKITLVADYFDVSIDYLVGRKEYENADFNFKMIINDDISGVVEKMKYMIKEQQKQVRDIVNVLDKK